MKSLLMALIAFNFSHAQTKPKEASVYITSLKEDEIDSKILESEVFQSCLEQVKNGTKVSTEAGKDKVRKCVEEKLDAVGDEELKKFSQSLKLDGVAPEETKTAKSLREYLAKRLFNSIHGENAYENKKLKEMKFVDQGMFLELYKSQISKNLILEVSRYCLENIGIDGNAGYILTGLAPDEESYGKGKALTDAGKAGKSSLDFALESGKLTVSASDVADTSEDKWKPKAAIENGSLGTFEGATLWKKIKEYKYCPNLTNKDPNDPCHKDNARNAQQIAVLKDQELKLGEKDTSLLQNKYLSCSHFLIKNMCELYRCNNIYDTKSTSVLYGNAAGETCPKMFGVSVADKEKSIALGSDPTKQKGQIACSVLKRVEAYKKTFAAIDEVQKQNTDLRGKAVGTDASVAYAGVFDGKNIDDMTSISSKELVEKVDAYGSAADEAKELEEKCFSGGVFNEGIAECKALASDVDSEDLGKVQLDTEAETAAYLKRLKELEKGDSNEELKEYLIKHGLSDYIPLMESGDINSEQLVKLIGDKYKADRQALIDKMKDKFYAMTKKESPSADPAAPAAAKTEKEEKEAVAETAKTNLKETQEHKERLETLFNYSNIVSSYLQVKDEEGKVTENSRARSIEKEGIEEYADAEEAQKYKAYFNDSTESGSGGSVTAQGQFIDDILGVGEGKLDSSTP